MAFEADAAAEANPAPTFGMTGTYVVEHVTAWLDAASALSGMKPQAQGGV